MRLLMAMTFFPWAWNCRAKPAQTRRCAHDEDILKLVGDVDQRGTAVHEGYLVSVSGILLDNDMGFDVQTGVTLLIYTMNMFSDVCVRLQTRISVSDSNK